MRKYLIIAAIALAAAPAVVTAETSATATPELTMDTVLGTTLDEVTAALTGMGYEIRRSEMEDGKIEVYFVKDKTMGEVYVSPETGKVLALDMD